MSPISTKLRKFQGCFEKLDGRFERSVLRTRAESFEFLTSARHETRACRTRALFSFSFFGQDGIFRRECSIYVSTEPYVFINHEMRQRRNILAVNALARAPRLLYGENRCIHCTGSILIRYHAQPRTRCIIYDKFVGLVSFCGYL